MEGFTHFLQHKYGQTLPEEGQHYLNRISTAATFMSKLVEGLLQLSHVGAQVTQYSAGIASRLAA